MIKRLVVGGVFVTILFAIAVYAWLGGFRSEQVEKISYDIRTVAGTPYQGAYGDLALREIFVTTQERLQENKELGTLVVVNYDSLAETQEVDQLIGILAEHASAVPQSGQTVDTLPAGDYLRVRLYGHPVVRPTPAQVNEKARRYAVDYQLNLLPLAVEHYFGTDSMWVEFPVEVN